MGKAIYGSLASGDSRLLLEVSRLRARVSDLESKVAELEAHRTDRLDLTGALLHHRGVADVLGEAEPVYA
jgi:hypothetical protein